MKTILITGATGNVGAEIIKYLSLSKTEFRILAGVWKDNEVNNTLGLPKVEAVHFDFEDEKSVAAALDQTDILFLLRPPQLSNIKKFFAPIISLARIRNIEHIVFLSVQGVEGNSLIPHYKIEKLLIESKINYTFLRPAYFMQNFTTTLRKDITVNDTIFLPAGNAKFTLIDVQNLGEVAAVILADTSRHINCAYELTNDEQLTFYQMADILSEELGRKIHFQSPNLLKFYIRKRKEKIPTMFILVMIMLHYLPRFKSASSTTSWVEKISQSKPRSFREYVKINQSNLAPIQ